MGIGQNVLRIVAKRIVFVIFLLVIVSGCSHKSVDDYLHDGDQAMANGQVANAETDYQSAMNAAPQDARPHLALGNLYAFEHKPAQAQPEYMKALDLDPKNAAVHADLGDAYADAQTSLAEAQYRAAVALDPATVSYRLKLGALLQKRNKLREAEAEFLTAIGLEPKNAHAHLALANLLSADPNRQTEAEAEYAQVRALDPSLMTAAPAVSAPPTVPTPLGSPTVGAAAPPQLRPLNRKFLLTHDSPVYEATDSSSRVLAQVHHRKLVHVTGIAGGWLRIQMKSGLVGYIPATAAE
jgi:tetratricopeptide (TPR) repeat protein